MTALTLQFRDSILFCDALLMERQTHHNPVHKVWAISVMGNEQVVRQFVATCNEDPRRRSAFSVVGPRQSCRCIWAPGKWWCQARQLGTSMTHLVAMPPPVLHPDPDVTEHLVLPRSEQDAAAELYGTLLRRYTTPLIPVGVTGQPDDEHELGKLWQERVSEAVEIHHVTRLSGHPDAPDTRWQHGRLLRMTNDELDRVVGTLLSREKLPMEVEEHAV